MTDSEIIREIKHINTNPECDRVPYTREELVSMLKKIRKDKEDSILASRNPDNYCDMFPSEFISNQKN